MTLLYASKDDKKIKEILIYFLGYLTTILIFIGIIWIIYNIITYNQFYLILLLPFLFIAIYIINLTPKDLLSLRIEIFKDKIIIIHHRELFAIRKDIKEYPIDNSKNISLKNSVLTYNGNGIIKSFRIRKSSSLSELKQFLKVFDI